MDENRAYELKTLLEIKHRAAEIIWGGLLLLFLGLTVKERIDCAIESTSDMVDSVLSTKKKK